MLYSNSFMDSISDFLDNDGGIVITSIDKLVNLMKEFHDKLVPKCMAITIISSSSTDAQMKLCDSGVWNILFQWLQDGLKNDTTCFILEILRLYLTLPISFENITSNSCPKLIKKLTKNGNPEIISISRSIVAKWRRIIEEKALKEEIEVPHKTIKYEENVIRIEKNADEKKKIRTVKVRNTDLRTAGVEDPEMEISRIGKRLIKKQEEKPCMEELHKKVIVDKRKVLEIHESKNFINSIMHTSAPPRKKKKRQDIIVNKSVSDISIVDDSVIDERVSPSDDSSTAAEKSKRRVSWAPTDSIENIKYFELDENERVNVNKLPIEDLKKKERMLERQHHTKHKLHIEEIDDESQQEKWYKPLLVIGVQTNKIEVTSVEKNIQNERERKVLKVLYFVKDAIPLTAKEPENEPYDVKEPLIIPLEDMAAPKSSHKPKVITNDINSKLLIYTENDGNECHVTLRPDVANLLKSMTQNPRSLIAEVQAPLDRNVTAEAPHTRSKLINIIRLRYPDIDPEKLTSAEVCRLLEPMRDHLISEGILSGNPNVSVAQPPPTLTFIPSQGVLLPPPPLWYNNDPRFHFPRHPHDMQMMQHMMPPIQFPHHNNNRLSGMFPPSNRPQFNQIPPMQQPRHALPICRFMMTHGYCQLGSNCTFSHILPDGPRQYNQNWA